MKHPAAIKNVEVVRPAGERHALADGLVGAIVGFVTTPEMGATSSRQGTRPA